jgi:hypothetical protein
LRAVCWQSVGEARLLLRDWLVIFTTNYHRNSYMRASAQQLLKLPVRHTYKHGQAHHPCPDFWQWRRLDVFLMRSLHAC